MNVGASAPEEAGLYFSWGNTDGHNAGDSYAFTQANYNSTPGVEISGNIPISQDAARVNMGDSWRMPTQIEVQELVENCTFIWTNQNGVAGALLTSNINGNSIFLPATGYIDDVDLISLGDEGDYWESSIHIGSSGSSLTFNESLINADQSGSRYFGFTVRAVKD